MRRANTLFHSSRSPEFAHTAKRFGMSLYTSSAASLWDASHLKTLVQVKFLFENPT